MATRSGMIPYVALVEDDEVFDPAIHARQDLGTIGRLVRSIADDYMATVSIDVKNPRVSLSSLPDHRILISDRGNLLFDGRLSVVPRGNVSSVVTIEAIARPDDLDDQISAMVEAHKTAPGYDPLCVPEGSEDEPSEVFAGYSKVVAYSPTGQISAVDALSGSSSMSLMPEMSSLRYDTSAVAKEFGVKLSVEWTQLGLQTFFDSSWFYDVSTMMPEALIQNFPKVGTSVGDGWTVTESLAREKVDAFGDAEREIVEREEQVAADELDPAFIEEGSYTLRAEIASMELGLGITYRFEANRKEMAEFSIPTGLQEGVHDDSTEWEEIGLRDIAAVDDSPAWRPATEYTIGDRVVDGGMVYEARRDHLSGETRDPLNWTEVGEASYISSRRAGSFLQSERGAAVIEHCVERIRARARIASRCVEVSFEAPMPDPWTVAEDMEVTLAHPQIPGGYVSGRLIRSDLIWEPGRRILSGTIGCAPGLGETDTAAAVVESAAIPFAGGRIGVEIRNAGEEQKAAFLAGEQISETEININLTPATVTDLEAEIPVSISGSVGIPRQMEA